VREEKLGLAGCAEARALDALDAGAKEKPLGNLGEVEHPTIGDPVAELGKLPEDLRPDFEAAWADSGPDRRSLGIDLSHSAGDDS